MYIDLVMVKFEQSDKKYLFQAPRFTHLKLNERVIVDTRRGQQEARVINSITLNPEGDDFDFIIAMTGATLPLKRVLARVKYEKFEYEEEDNGTDND